MKGVVETKVVKGAPSAVNLQYFEEDKIALFYYAINCTKKKDITVPSKAPIPPGVTPSPDAGKSAEVKKSEDLKPQVFEKNEKEKMIAEGQLKRNKHDYPTFDDVISDWESEDGEGGKKKKKEKKIGDGKDDNKKDDEKKSEKTKSKMTDAGEKKSEKK
uniref:Uncharacterized protein n=1 Tax=Panagrolaimus davidi TaxID=227884 RepID=A0A914PM73_9BILA